MDLYPLAPSGVFSAAAARASGIGAPLLRQLVAEGKCHPLHRGWYSIKQPGTEKERHKLRVAALLQEYGGRVMASHGSAVAWLDLPDERIDWGTVHLMWRKPGMQFRAMSRVHIHELVQHPKLTHADDAVDISLAAIQVGLRDPRSMLVVADHALHHGLISPESLRAAADAMVGQRGITRARVAIPWADGRHESPGETLTAFVLRRLGYTFTPQFEIPRPEAPGRSYFADFHIKGTKVLLEFDGKVKYDDPDANFAEKQREDEIRRTGHRVVRVTQSTINQPALVQHLVDTAIRADAMDDMP